MKTCLVGNGSVTDALDLGGREWDVVYPEVVINDNDVREGYAEA